MPNKTINDYSAASGIDPINDYLLIEPSSLTVYNKINRNVLLGITGSPLGTTDSQSISNKTIGNTNSITVKDGSLTLQNTSDITKQAVFSLASITTGNTRTFTLPDASTTLVGTGTTQTLTAKTLTSPSITGGTYDNGTITVDSIAGHSTSTVVTVAGVQFNNGVIATSNSITNNGAIAAGAIIPNTLVASSGTAWTWQTWSPTLANLTIGNGTSEYKYTQIGKTVFFRAIIIFGSSSSMGTSPTITLPVTAATYAGTDGNQLGVAVIRNSGVAFYEGSLMFVNTTTALFQVVGTGSTYATETGITATVPISWAVNDSIQVQGYYEAA